MKTALVTGASSGIGSELAKIFARNRFNLVLIARREQKLKDLAKELEEKCSISVKVIAKDLSHSQSAKDIFDEIKKENIIITHLVNNAGFDTYGLFEETDWKREEQMLQLNVVTLTELTKLFIPEMKAKGFGRIMNVGSTGSFAPVPLNAVYCATKAYVLSFSEAISEELLGSGVTVTALCPGVTRTEFAHVASMERVWAQNHGVMDAASVAEIGFFAMVRGKRMVVAGLMNKIMVFLIRFTPRILVVKISKLMLGQVKKK